LSVHLPSLEIIEEEAEEAEEALEQGKQREQGKQGRDLTEKFPLCPWISSAPLPSSFPSAQ
jgi:hypothetical protein